MLTEPVVRKVQAMLDEGQEPSKVAEVLGIKWNTLQKAIAAGKLHAPQKKPSTALSSKSTRSAADSEAAMGMGATDTFGRVMASVGMLAEKPVQFEAAMDVANGGVLLSLPALLANGLLRHTNKQIGVCAAREAARGPSQARSRRMCRAWRLELGARRTTGWTKPRHEICE